MAGFSSNQGQAPPYSPPHSAADINPAPQQGQYAQQQPQYGQQQQQPQYGQQQQQPQYGQPQQPPQQQQQQQFTGSEKPYQQAGSPPPQQPMYGQPQQSMAGQAQQPMQPPMHQNTQPQQPQQQQQQQQGFQTAIPIHSLGPGPAPIDCPACGMRQMTRIQFENGNTVYAWALGLCICLCLGCIPFCMDSLKDVAHFCGHCGVRVATYHRGGATEQHVHR